MSETVELPPSAASLSSSMRDLGYTLEAAVADLVDNSLAAGATEIAVHCPTSELEPILAVIDNGHGMSRDALFSAMRHGSRGDSRNLDHIDLGKYGLGLKTASLSQCRQLTVLSRSGGEETAMEWDLDLIDQHDKWLLRVLSADEAQALPFANALGAQGTAVIWRQLDRVVETSSRVTQEEQLAELVRLMEDHLSLVFHRFIDGEFGKDKKLAISINGHRVEAIDPFMRYNNATQRLSETPATVDLGTGKVQLRAYILPHFSKLSGAERGRYNNWQDYVSQQGAYVYRSGRLLAWGDWFRVATKAEATKYARVQVDFDSSVDDHWSIDIMKSKAEPPREVKERLKRLLHGEISKRSSNVHRGRGVRLLQDNPTPLWERFADRNEVRYEVNFEHPLVKSLTDRFEESDKRMLRTLFGALAASLPAEMIYADFASKPQDVQRGLTSSNQLIPVLRRLRKSMFGENPIDADEFRAIVEALDLLRSGNAEEFEKFLEGEV